VTACLTFAGTWAAPGTGYPSDVAQACADVVEEIPVQAPWSFGPIPPYDDQGARAPSYQESVGIACDWAVDWILSNPDRPIMLGGYSQGGEAASRVRAEFDPGGRLAGLRHNFVAGYCFGNPSRHLEHTFHGGPPTDGEGIAQFRLPPIGPEWCELVDTYDLYAGVPATLTGEIMRDVYTLCTQLQLHDMRAFARDLAANCIAVVQNLDGDAYDDLIGGSARHGVDLTGASLFPPEDFALIDDKILSVKGIAAAIQAAILGIQFLCWQPPTAPHIEYHLREVFPGQTYLQLGVQHVRDWASRP
jgi:hypothetical protein